MCKFFSVLMMLFITSCLFAADVLNMKLGKFDVTAINIQSMEHNKKLFRYKDSKALENFLNQQDSASSAINVFYVDTGDHKILFDTGINAKELAEKLKNIKIAPENIDIICITHTHYDHITGLVDGYNKMFPNAVIYISKEEFKASESSDIFKLYKDKIKTFDKNEQILPYIKTIPAFGHTVGHTMFEITSDGQTMLVWGDILHAPIQFQDPEIFLTYDTDPIQALSVRKKVMQNYADSDKYIAGAHLLNCGIGKLQKNKSGGYKFIFLKTDNK
ncbi:MBL fold metallo-hydrolase [Candidatus Ruminimicrobium bovinum]|uniref:MBL fold metallo-hydrolase n=1 Tax=Candidatus Ruminimicrobium bovinum TaxID=3242779 RepID=UPI0039B8CD42